MLAQSLARCRASFRSRLLFDLSSWSSGPRSRRLITIANTDPSRGPLAVLVQELCAGPVLGGQEPSAHQPKADRGEIRHDERSAEALGQPLHEMHLCPAPDLHGVTNLHRDVLRCAAITSAVIMRAAAAAGAVGV